MLVRLLLTLMLAIGAMPMPAACHERMPMAHEMSGPQAAPDQRRDHHPAAEHGCIGCAALDDWMSDRIAPHLAPAAVNPDPSPSRLTLARAGPPTLRPPRIG